MRTQLSKSLLYLCTGVCVMGAPRASHAAIFQVADGDVAGLIAAINAANANLEPDSIILAANGNYTLANPVNALNGLPAIVGHITILGAGAVIQRGASVPGLRFFFVTPTGSLTLYNLTLHNGAVGGGLGGAIWNEGHLTLYTCTFTGNEAFEGGAIYSDPDNGSLRIDSSVFKDNTARLFGGAVKTRGTGPKEITRSSFEWNSIFAPPCFNCSGGGALEVVLNENDTAKVSENTFSGNQSVGAGGAILLVGGGPGLVAMLRNNTFSSNVTHQSGGGLAVLLKFSGTVIVVHSTFSRNAATISGGGIVLGEKSLLVLVNTIIANSTNGDCAVGPSASISGNASNLIADGSCNPAFSGSAGLNSLADNGGPTKTHALLAGSPALDNAAGFFCPATDQRGVPRPVGPACDIGAWEGVPEAARRGASHHVVPFQPPDFHPIPPPCDPLREVIEVILPGGETFDAGAVLPNTVSLGNAQPGTALPTRDPLRDVDRDGHLDLVMRFSLTDVYRGLSCKSITALPLQGLIRSGDQFFGNLLVIPNP